MPVRWKTTQLLPGSTAQPVKPVKLLAAAAAPKHVEGTLMSGVWPEIELDGSRQDIDGSRQARRYWGRTSTREGQPQLRESIVVSPKGRKWHTLQRTSPGGTTRTSQYISPTRAEVFATLGYDGVDMDWLEGIESGHVY